MTKNEIGRTRRPMECALTDPERKQRSDQVHAELELRTKDEEVLRRAPTAEEWEMARRDTLDSEAKAPRLIPGTSRGRRGTSPTA